MHPGLFTPQIFACALAYLLAFFLPGYFFSKWLRSPAPLLSAFVLSVMLLYQGFFWLEIAGIPLKFSTMLSWEIGVTIIAFIAWIGMGTIDWRASSAGILLPPSSGTPGEGRGGGISSSFILHPSSFPPAPTPTLARNSSRGSLIALLIALPILTGVILLLRSWLVPLTGPDLCNRWDQLAREILRLGHYGFYPPRSAQDFQHYGFAESLPPMLTSALWWIYASMGHAVPRATAVFVVLQYAVLAGFVYRLTRRIASSLTAAIATAILAAAPLTFFSLVIGEEAGLVAIGALAMLYFIFPKPKNLSADDGWRSALLAGAAAAFAPLSREFALGYLALGLILAICLRRDVRWLIFFSLTAAALTLPWYLRTWALTGNPLYSLPVFNLFPVNPIVAAQYEIARRTRSIWVMPFSAWKNLLSMLLQLAPLQLIFSIPLVIAFLRRQRSMLVAWLVFSGLWLFSIGLTDSLWYWSRMLLPTAAVLSILLAIGATQLLSRWKEIRMVVFALLLLCWCYSAAFALIYPRRLADTPPRDWIASSLAIDPPLWQNPVIDANLSVHLPPGQRILSANLYAWSAQLHSPNQVVPLWSPEVRFIFDSRLQLTEIYQRLHQLHIRAVLLSEKDLHRYPANQLYSQVPKHWLLLTSIGPDNLYHLPSN